MYLLLVQGNFGFAQTDTLAINTEVSKVTFSIKHMGILNVEGAFKEFKGRMVIKNKKLFYLESAITVSSINTEDDSRDKTIVSEDYLDVDSFPLITFVSETINEKDIIGTLKIKDVVRQITMPYAIDNRGVISISTSLSREQFELDFGAMNGLIGNTIKVELKLRTK